MGNKLRKKRDDAAQQQKKGPSANVKRVGKMGSLEEVYEVNWSKDGELGSGHYATVYRGKNKTTGQLVAVKRIKRALTRLETLRAEVDALRKVKGHPNIMGLYDVFYDDDYVVLVLEMLGGGELFDRIVKSGAYSERDASQHMAKLAAALAFMHGQGIVHRDLKPENLVLKSEDPDSDICIGDFGLSKILKDDQVTMKTVCGTRAYSAPEVNFGGTPGSARYTERVDMWSLGVILYVILAAYHPFDPPVSSVHAYRLLYSLFSNFENRRSIPRRYGDSDDGSIWRKIVKGEWDFDDPVWDHLSGDVKDLLRHLICLDPDERFSAKQMLAHNWITKHKELPTSPLQSSKHMSGKRSLTNLKMPGSNRNILAADNDVV